MPRKINIQLYGVGVCDYIWNTIFAILITIVIHITKRLPLICR